MFKSKERANEYYKEWYWKNREKRILQIRKYQNKIKFFIRKYKIEKGCKNCSENYWACLEFHHREKNKEFNIGRIQAKGWGMEKIMIELNKCDVLCSNCHRKLHHPPQ